MLLEESVQVASLSAHQYRRYLKFRGSSPWNVTQRTWAVDLMEFHDSKRVSQGSPSWGTAGGRAVLRDDASCHFPYCKKEHLWPCSHSAHWAILLVSAPHRKSISGYFHSGPIAYYFQLQCTSGACPQALLYFTCNWDPATYGVLRQLLVCNTLRTKEKGKIW